MVTLVWNLNLDGHISEDIYKKKPSREEEEYSDSNSIYNLTFDDADMDREVFSKVFEEFDRREDFRFRTKNPVKVLNGETETEEEKPADRKAYNSGDEVSIFLEKPSAKGEICGEWGPSNSYRHQAVYSGPTLIYTDVNGGPVTEAVSKITENTDAPYLESNPEKVQYSELGGFNTGRFEVPPTFTENELKESVDAWIDRVSQVNELQEDIRQVCEGNRKI